ncbi:MAG TPA: SAF domain-containing protein, partial [Terriglobales bacterium]|nr:SAF domain-containing protein [Terriglobales bacterium]
AFSLEPGGMRRLVRDLRRASVALGDGIKRVYPSEDKPLVKMAKKVVAARNLPAGHTIVLEDIALKSPNDGLAPNQLDRVIGKRTRRSLAEDENILLDDVLDA